MATDWQVKRLAGALGAEVSGTDLTTTSGSDVKRIRRSARWNLQKYYFSWTDY